MNLRSNIPKFIIEWSEESLVTFQQIYSYIVTKWSVLRAEQFDKKVVSLLKKLEINEELCTSSKIKNIRKCVVTKQTSFNIPN